LRWSEILEDEQARGVHRVVVVAGLDNWESRLSLCEDLRHADGFAREGMLLIQVGLDREQSAIAVLGNRFADPCPACGLSVLPSPEPCVAWNNDGELVRGNLQCEAKEAAGFVRRVVRDMLGPARRRMLWLNTKTNLFQARAGADAYRRVTRRCRMQEGCPGPHTNTPPLKWEGLASAASLMNTGSSDIGRYNWEQDV